MVAAVKVVVIFFLFFAYVTLYKYSVVLWFFFLVVCFFFPVVFRSVEPVWLSSSSRTSKNFSGLAQCQV